MAGAVNDMDNLVLDKLLSTVVKRGMELSMGKGGGILLYSLPTGGIRDSDHALDTFTRDARRRIIRATDHMLEHVLFHPGGIWEMLWPKWTDFLVEKRRNEI